MKLIDTPVTIEMSNDAKVRLSDKTRILGKMEMRFLLTKVRDEYLLRIRDLIDGSLAKEILSTDHLEQIRDGRQRLPLSPSEALIGAGRFLPNNPRGAEWDSNSCITFLGRDRPENAQEATEMLDMVRDKLESLMGSWDKPQSDPKLVLDPDADTEN